MGTYTPSEISCDHVTGMRTTKPLPLPGATATLHTGCCLALSALLLEHLRALLPPRPALVLSVGSGFGLLEAMLLAQPYEINVVGIEVQPSPNEYLPDLNHRVVHGSRFLDPLAAEAAAWLFVYPRRVSLIREYLDEYSHGAVRRVIWAGPKADWEDYKSCFSGCDIRTTSAEEIGGRAWELVAVADTPPTRCGEDRERSDPRLVTSVADVEPFCSTVTASQ